MSKKQCYTKNDLCIIDIQASSFLFEDVRNLRTAFWLLYAFARNQSHKKSAQIPIPLSAKKAVLSRNMRKKNRWRMPVARKCNSYEKKQKQEILGILHTLSATHEAVSCLEEYCEILYGVYEALILDGGNPSKAYWTLHKQLVWIENIVRN